MIQLNAKRTKQPQRSTELSPQCERITAHRASGIGNLIEYLVGITLLQCNAPASPPEELLPVLPVC
jgi:hypothetical protein